MSYLLSDEHRALREAARSVADAKIAPFAAAVDAESRFPAEALDFFTECFESRFEGPSFFGKTVGVGARSCKTLFGETGFGLPPVEPAQGIRCLLAF